LLLMEVRKLIGWNIRRLRVAAGLSLEDLADMAALSPNYLGELERGKVNVGVDAVARLAEALDARLIELIEEQPPGPPPQALRAGRKPRRRKAR
jgi:transcriptional regulator with XRE-family HTH domain